MHCVWGNERRGEKGSGGKRSDLENESWGVTHEEGEQKRMGKAVMWSEENRKCGIMGPYRRKSLKEGAVHDGDRCCGSENRLLD